MPNDTLEVRRHDFQEAKANIKIFSEKKIDSPTFESVATEKYFGLLNHSVTGSELNERISKIQHHFIAINLQLNEVKSQFGNIYETFESLDKDYIEGMLASIGAASKASDQALKAAEEAKKNSDDVERSLQIHIAVIEKLEKEKMTPIQDSPRCKMQSTKSKPPLTNGMRCLEDLFHHRVIPSPKPGNS